MNTAEKPGDKSGVIGPNEAAVLRLINTASDLERVETATAAFDLACKYGRILDASAASSTPSLGNGANGLRWFLETFLKALDVHNGHGTPSLARAEAYALEAEAKLMLAGHSTTGTIQWSGMNDLTDWSPKEDFDALVFANYTEAKKAEVLFNRLLREAESAKNWLRAQRDTAEEKLKETAPSATPRSDGMPLLFNVFNMICQDRDEDWKEQWRELMKEIELVLTRAGYTMPKAGGDYAVAAPIRPTDDTGAKHG